MKYQAPYGVSDPNAPYINGDPTIGRQGSIPPAAAFEYPMREINNVIVKNKFIPDDADLGQVLKATRSQACNYAQDSGSVNTLSVAYDPPLTTYTIGLPLRVKVYVTNTGGATIDAGGGRVPIRRPDGSNVQPGDLPGGGIIDLVFDGAVFQMVNYLGGAAAGDVINNFSNVPYTVDSSTTANIITANFTPPITTLVAGTLFLVKIANTCSGDTVINVNGFLNKPVRTNSGGKLLPGDVTANDIKLFCYDGVNFFLDPNPNMPQSATLPIPSVQFPDVPTTLTDISRKTISSAATLTISLAIGTYPPIWITHKDASRIVIKGTMKAAAPGHTDFFQTGSSSAARASDAVNNLAMLRTRYGTEIHVPAGQPGFSNFGPGDPTLQDVLIVGTGAKTDQAAGVATDWSFPLATTNLTINVAIWGCSWGYYCGGMQRISGGSVTNCGHGPTAVNGSHIHISGNFHSSGNDGAGVYAANESFVVMQSTGGSVQSNFNGQYGTFAANGSMVNVQGAAGSVVGNGLWDCYSYNTSTIVITAGTPSNTFNPPIGTIGNFNANVLPG